MQEGSDRFHQTRTPHSDCGTWITAQRRYTQKRNQFRKQKRNKSIPELIPELVPELTECFKSNGKMIIQMYILNKIVDISPMLLPLMSDAAAMFHFFCKSCMTNMWYCFIMLYDTTYSRDSTCRKRGCWNTNRIKPNRHDFAEKQVLISSIFVDFWHVPPPHLGIPT